MTYTRPQIRITDMAIYLDANINNKEHDEQQCYQYLYHIIYSLSSKKRLFKNFDDYDRFSLFMASKLYMRYKRVHDENKPLPPITGALNYIKKTMQPMRVAYQEMAFQEIINDEIVCQGLKGNVERVARSQSAPILQADVSAYLNSTTNIIRELLTHSYYAQDKVLHHNITMSVLLSLLKEMTLRNSVMQRLQTGKIKRSLDNFIIGEYSKYDPANLIMYGLPEHMENYIRTLVARTKKLMAKDINELISSHELSDDMVAAILLAPILEEADEKTGSK